MPRSRKDGTPALAKYPPVISNMHCATFPRHLGRSVIGHLLLAHLILLSYANGHIPANK
jgi:hypothetical protein